ncbi:hypothetical protein JF540_27025 [Salipiger thiooxidans]|uniref:hypothetical protein n=1 Tax=Salipiger thiooxidans TaxID=282683 RepID=UPI001A9060EB|nr:hypothetical protein [Salipiger thiooxidans]MBN8190316.1 hypothetical protein [Salipiger thiooxidans]
MINLFKTAEEILAADTDDLLKLAEIAGYDPRVMYLNADLSHADLRGQDVSFLVGLNADYETAILSSEQRSYLKKHDAPRVQPETRNQRILIADLRYDIIKDYLESGISLGSRQIEELLKPLMETRAHAPTPKFEAEYLLQLLTEVSVAHDGFRNLDEQKRFFATINRARLTYRAALLPALAEAAPACFYSNHFAETFDVNNCTVDFIVESLERIKDQDPHGLHKVLRKVISSKDDLPDRLVAFTLTQEPNLDLMKELLSRLTDKSLIRAKIGFANVLTAQTRSGNHVREYADALEGAPSFRMAYLDSAMKSKRDEVALAALRTRSAQKHPISSIELSDIAYHLKDHGTRLKYARQAESILTPHQHRILVTEIEKIAQTRRDSEAVKRQWPGYFGLR